ETAMSPTQSQKRKPLKPAFARAKSPRQKSAHVTFSRNLPPVFPTDSRDGVRASPRLRAQAGFGGAEGDRCTLLLAAHFYPRRLPCTPHPTLSNPANSPSAICKPS